MNGMYDMLMNRSRGNPMEQPEVAKYLYTSAKQRIETGYPETKKLFEALCTSSDKCCMNELIDEQLDGWHDELVMKVQKLGSK